VMISFLMMKMPKVEIWTGRYVLQC
jgi:hypothetical protein